MSLFYQDIHAALRTRLRSLTDVPPIALTNWNYSPDSNSVYLRESFLPAETVKACMGRSGKDLYNGIYQVDVYAPDDSGPTTWPDKIANHFYNQALTNDDATVEVLSISQGAGFNDDNFYIVPVSIRWRSFTAARI